MAALGVRAGQQANLMFASDWKRCFSYIMASMLKVPISLQKQIAITRERGADAACIEKGG